ncbi:hypothetical protein Q2941_15260 [Bradyrhizobium sp. UFLA05-153]
MGLFGKLTGEHERAQLARERQADGDARLLEQVTQLAIRSAVFAG